LLDSSFPQYGLNLALVIFTSSPSACCPSSPAMLFIFASSPFTVVEIRIDDEVF